MIPQPVLTRWGTWLSAVEYYVDNFEAVKVVIDQLNGNDAQSIRDSKKSFASPNVREQLAFIKANFMCIVSSIKKLETKALELKEYLNVYEDIISKMDMLDDPDFKLKFENIIKRNVGFTSLVQTAYVQKLAPSKMALFKHVPVTSVDVEYTFSVYKTVLSAHRRSFTFENFTKHLIFACNKSISHDM